MKAFGIINFEGSNVNVAGLTEFRPVPAFSFLGRYRLIDIMLSNMTNSGIGRIKVFMNNQTRSLIEHLGTGRHYNINSKRGQLQLLTSDPNINSSYNNDVNAFLYNLEAIEGEDADYVVIAPSYIIYPLDFRKVIDANIRSGADITVVYKAVDNAQEHFIDCTMLNINNEGRVVEMAVNQGKYKNRNISLETYVLKKELFVELLKEAPKISSMFWWKDIIEEKLDKLNIQGFACKHECYCINSLNEFFWANMRLKDHKVARELFSKDWPIHTRTNDSAPAYYGEKADCKDSIVSNGAMINGKVDNSVVGRQVFIEEGAEVRNCVLLAGARIGKGVKISNAVVDKKAVISRVKVLGGKPNDILYVKRKDKI